MARVPSALEKVQQLQEEMASVREQAKDEALGVINEQIEALKKLGYDYKLSKGNQSSKSEREASSGPCPICEFETNPHHDGRRHRSQGDDKKAFTARELRDMGMEKFP